MNTQSPILETWMIYHLIVALEYQTLQLDLQKYQTKSHELQEVQIYFRLPMSIWQTNKWCAY
jgi:hypothetical protein